MVVWIRRLAWGVGAVLLLWVVTWLALPPLIRWQGPPRLSEALGRTVTFGDVKLSPWGLDLTVDALVIAGLAPTSEPLLRVRRIRADLSLSTLFRRAPVIEALEFDAPQLRLTHLGAGRYDVDDLIARFASHPGVPPLEPARFALYNLQVRDGSVRFADRPSARVHRIEDLRLTLPFLSNLPADVQVAVEPRLEFKLNGTPFDSGAQATPFAQNKTGALKLAVTGLDLAPYLPYLPASLPVRVTHGNVSADLSLEFAVPHTGLPSVALKGSVGANDLALSDATGRPLLALQRLQLGLRDVRPLARRLAFDALRIDGLQLHVTRDAAGRINPLQLVAPSNSADGDALPAAGGTASRIASPAASAGASGAATSAPPDAPWRLSLESLDLADARVFWNDAAVQPAASVQLDGLTVGIRQLQWPIVRPVMVALHGSIHGARGAEGPNAAAPATFAVDGPLTDHDAKLKLAIEGLPLDTFAPYLAQVLTPVVQGRLTAQAQLDWSGAAGATRFQIAIDSATLDAFSLHERGERSARGARAEPDAIAFKQLVLGAARLDMLARSVALRSVKLVQPVVTLAREADGRLSLQRWSAAQVAPRHAGPTPRGPRPTTPLHPAAPEWRVQLKDLLLEGGQLRFTDAMVHAAAVAGARAAPLRVGLENLRVAVRGFEWWGARRTAPAEVQISARIAHARADASRLGGAIDYRGRIGVQPLFVAGRLRAERVPLHRFAPYFADRVQLTLLRAEAGYTGSVSLRQLPAGLDVQAAGDVLLANVHVATLPGANAPASADNTDELLSWQSLALKGVKVTIKPNGKPRVEIGAAALDDFYSRLVVTEQGRFNLQDLEQPPAGQTHPGPVAAAAPAPASAAPSAPVGSATAGLPLDLVVGTTTLRNGRIDFTDHFVRPNYSAALTDLNGHLGAFSSGSREMATLELRGRAEGTAQLEIDGQLNPGAKPLALDIKARVTDLELAPLSPYAGKYAGYAIERGKLSMKVAYKIDADGKLNASNQLVLNQLTFGDRIESKEATKLPVLLAVALLKDRNGVIDVNLPVNGSLDDPKFSVGGIILKVIVNLLTKAITAPFALLSGGGSDDLSVVAFQPGTALLAAGSAAAIDTVAKALNDRPTLKLTVTGTADPATERDAYARAALDGRLLAEQRREAMRAGAPGPSASAPHTLDVDESTRLLERLYKNTDLPTKPRNALGFAKDIPVSEMQTLLMASAPVTADAMRALALQRGVAVRDALIEKGLPSARLFVAAPRLRAPGEGDATWSPRAQLALSVN